MPIVSVSTPTASYDVTIAPGILGTLYPRIRKLLGGKKPRVFVVTSPEIWTRWSKAFLASFPVKPEVLFLPPGERHKRLPSVERLAQELAMAGADRDSLLIAFGGGVLGDITGSWRQFTCAASVCAGSEHAAGAGGFLGRREDGGEPGRG